VINMVESVVLSPEKVKYILALYEDSKTEVWKSKTMKNVYLGKSIALEHVLLIMGFSLEDLRNYLSLEDEG